jgi:hypothetical protein
VAPHGFSDTTMQIEINNIQPFQIGTFKVVKNNFFFNFQLSLMNDSIFPYIKLNKGNYINADTLTAFTGDSVYLNPMPSDSVGWVWSWTGPNNFTSNQREIKLTLNSLTQQGIYSVTGTDGLNCGTVLKSFKLTVLKRTGITENNIVSDIEIYQNPSHDGIFYFKNCSSAMVLVYNLNGELTDNFIINSERQTISLSNQAKESYVIKIVTDKGTYTKKVTIQ